MDSRIEPGKLTGCIRGVDSKSHAHRLLIASALAGDCPPEITDESRDILATKRALADLLNGKADIYCGESASTLRFLIPLSATMGREISFWGEGELPSRPLSPLIEELESHGANVCRADTTNQRKICTISGALTNGTFRLPGNISSQFVSGLLFALPLLRGDSRIVLTSPLESAGYVELTLDVLARFGIRVDIGATGYTVYGNQRYVRPSGSLAPEADWSSGAFWLAANALGSEISVGGLNMDSLQPDKAIVDIIQKFREGGERIIDAAQIPDLIPIICVLAALTDGQTTIVNGQRLRLKESDRIKATCALIGDLGGLAQETADGLIVTGQSSLAGGTCCGAGDHRIVMAAAIAATACTGSVTIEGAQAVQKSYPLFWEHFSKLGGVANEIPNR